MKNLKQVIAKSNKLNNVKKSILVIAAFILSLQNMNASNTKIPTKPSTEVNILTRDNIAQVFEWKVETNKGMYSGTSLSLESARDMMALSSKGEIILGTEITSYFITKHDLNSNSKRNYFWEVETATGSAKGYASSEAYAHKMIDLVASGDAIVSKIIISQPQQ